MRPELLIPLADLPGPVPLGVVVRDSDGMAAIVVGSSPDGDVIYLACSKRDRAGASELSLDLTAPPLDAAGYPTRIDGADVAAGMLARAIGRPRAADHRISVLVVDRHVTLWHGLYVYAPVTPSWVCPASHKRVAIPALADIDPTDPDADRLALAAVILAAPWRK